MKAAYQGLYTIEDGKRVQNESAYAIVSEMTKEQMNKFLDHFKDFRCEGYAGSWDAYVQVEVCDKEDYKYFMKVYKEWKKTC